MRQHSMITWNQVFISGNTNTHVHVGPATLKFHSHEQKENVQHMYSNLSLIASMVCTFSF